MEETFVKVAGDVVTHFLWIAFLLGLLFLLGIRNLRALLLSVRKVTFSGFVIELSQQVETAVAAKKKGVQVSDEFRHGIAESLERLSTTAPRARVLWIDPRPGGNVAEISVLTRLGASVDLARTDGKATVRLRESVYDLVLSNMTRDNDERAGELFIDQAIPLLPVRPTVIFYVGKARPKPRLAFGITTRPDELFHLIQRALERKV